MSLAVIINEVLPKLVTARRDLEKFMSSKVAVATNLLSIHARKRKPYRLMFGNLIMQTASVTKTTIGILRMTNAKILLKTTGHRRKA